MKNRTLMRFSSSYAKKWYDLRSFCPNSVNNPSSYLRNSKPVITGGQYSKVHLNNYGQLYSSVKRIIALLTVLVCLVFGSFWVNVDNGWAKDKIKDINVFIVSNEIGHKDLIEMLKKKLDDTFDHIEIIGNRKSVVKDDEIIIIPKSCDVSYSFEKGKWVSKTNGKETGTSRGATNANSTASIEVIFHSDSKEFNLSGKGRSRGIAETGTPLDLIGSLLDIVSFGGYQAGRESLQESNSKKESFEVIAVELESSILQSSEFKKFADNVRVAKSLPSDLILSISFSDSNGFQPNEVLDAGESAEAIIVITNKGKGAGYETHVELYSDNEHIKYEKKVIVGDIQPGEAKEIKVPFKADLNLQDGKANFTFKVTEKRGYDSKPVVLRVATNHIERPKLAITSHEINDGRTGMANGNGNGVPENGETIELTAFITNSGTGDAQGVKLNLQEINPGIEIVQNEAAIGTIAPGQTAKGKIVFAIPRTYAGKGIDCKLAVSDMRLGQETTKDIALGFDQKRPILAWSSRILSRGTVTTGSANGETVELEITPRNDGGIPAKYLSLAIAATAIGVSPESKSIREIQPGAAGTPQRFEIAIPRSYTKTELPIHIVLRQADFEGKEDTLSIPIRVKAPILSYTAVISGKHSGNIIEQNEGASLDVQIQNTGNLEARDVHVSLNLSNSDVRLKGEREIVIPVIPTKGFSETIKYDLFVFRKVPAGDLPVSLNVSQADFPPVNFAHKLIVKAEGAEVIEIAGNTQRKSIGPQSSGPVMAIARPMSGTRVYEKSIDLAGTIADGRGIDTIRVEVNGRQAKVNIGGTSDINKKQFSCSVPLAAGENRIRVIARNKDNVSSEETTVVYREEAGAAGTAVPPLSNYCDVDSQILSMPLSKKPNGKKWAVVIGVEEYRSAPAVPYARRDAQAFKEYLTRRLNVPEENIFTLIDKDAILTEIRDVIEDRLPAHVDSGDTVYFYFAGHGVPDISNRAPYLLPHDGKVRNPKMSALPASDLYESLGQLKAERVFVFLDSCFSGAGRSTEEQQMLITDARIAGFKVNDPVLKQKNIIVMSATEANQVSNAYKDKQHGLFTYFLLKGMIENKGPVKINDLYGYLKRNVPDLAVREYGPNRQQTPVLKGMQVSDNPLFLEEAP
jgi:hypothetical protein